MKKLTKKAPLMRLRKYLKINLLFFLNIIFPHTYWWFWKDKHNFHYKHHSDNLK